MYTKLKSTPICILNYNNNKCKCKLNLKNIETPN